MHVEPKNIRRQVIPRWRQLHRTRPEELKSTVKADENWQNQLKALREREVVKAASTWRAKPTLGNASEFVAAALATEHEQQAAGAARQIVAAESNATNAARRVARRLLNGFKFAGLKPDSTLLIPESSRDYIYGELHRLKRRIAIYPPNALVYVEIARLYSSIGQMSQAESAIEKAVILAPQSRFVLRAASRLFIHQNDPRRAHDLLRRNDVTRHDPWLLSAEIALSAVADRSSKFVSSARELLNLDRLAPLQISELAAALGTTEIAHGAHRSGTKLMRRSLIDPTDNSVAQARWVAQEIGSEFSVDYLSVQGTFEARAEDAHSRGADPNKVLEHCTLWWEDEPFSARPATLGSYTAAARLFDYDLALKFADAGLIASPGSTLLANNKVVALAKLGRLSDARTELTRIKEKLGSLNPVIRATEGLVYFREGNVDAGRKCYEQAIREANEMHNTEVAIRARAHLLEERVVAGIFDRADAIAELDRDIAELDKDFRTTKNQKLISLWGGLVKHLRAITENTDSNSSHRDTARSK